MAIINRDPRELNVEVYLSAIAMTDGTLESGNYSFVSALADPQNTRPLNFDYAYNEDRPFLFAGIGVSSPRLGRKVKFLPSFQSANILEVLTNPSASSCTFAYGGIDSIKHPVFDLLYGPLQDEYEKYKNKFGFTYPAFQSEIQGLKPPEEIPITDISQTKPFIPFINSTYTGSAEALRVSDYIKFHSKSRTTYNIWQILTAKNSNTIKYEGPITEVNLPSIRTIRDGINGSSVYVNTKFKNESAKIARLFPTNKDAVFYDPDNIGKHSSTGSLIRNDANVKPSIFYPTYIRRLESNIIKANSFWLDFDPISAQGSDNVGFHLKIENLDIGGSDSKIILNYESDENINKIFGLSVELINNEIPKITITYKNEIEGKSTKTFKQLKAPIFGTRNFYDIFIHFVGPNLIVGFENDQSLWNTIYASEFQKNTNNNLPDTKALEFKFLKDKSFVILDCKNINFSFKYSALIFDNYNFDLQNISLSDSNNEWKNINSRFSGVQSGFAYSTLITNNHILMSFKTKNDVEQAINSVNPDNLLDSLIKNKFMSLEYPDKYNLNYVNNGGISVFGDWRNTYIDNVFSSTGMSSVFRYKELAKKTDGNILETFGKLLFNGTIEGPIFMGLRNLVDLPNGQAAEGPDVPFLKKIYDISSFVSGNIEIECQSTNPNMSFVTKNASVTLSNLDFNPGSDLIGLKLQEILEHNVLVITIRAGYGDVNNDDKLTYFQGVITEVSTTRTGSNSRTTLRCEDLGKYILENIFFEGYTPFTSYSFRNVFKAIMKVSGFYDYFKIKNEKDIANIDDILSPNPQENQAILLASRYDRILDRINQFLSKMVKVPTAEKPQGQPTFRWQPKEGFILDARWSSNNTDSLIFTGIGYTGDTFNKIVSTRNTNGSDPGWHGLLSESFTINTNINTLAARVETFGNTILNGYISRESDKSFEDNALSSQSLQNLINYLDDSNTGLSHAGGYVGFRKTIQDNLDSNEIFSEALLDFKHEQNVNICTFPFHSLSFDCYVTKPLNHFGTFAIKQFLPDDVNKTENYSTSDRYIYSSLRYTIDKNSNLIKAQITGVRQPWTIRELEINNST